MNVQDIFYVVVCDDNEHKKAYRRSFNSYVRFPPATLSETPTLFPTKAEALEAKKVAEASLGTGKHHFEVHPFRLFQSQTDYFSDERQARIADARRVASGMMFYDEISENIKKLAGKVLTILDAAYVNENQNKAVKDLVKTSFRAQLSDMWKKAFRDPDDLCEEAEGSSAKDILD